MKNLLITGSAGFIGYHTTLRLLNQGYRIFGLDNLNTYYDPKLKIQRLFASGIQYRPENHDKPYISELDSGYEFKKIDLSDRKELFSLFERKGFDTVIHLAAQPGARHSVDHPDEYINTNIQGFLNILEACRAYPVEHLLYASSSSIYGNNEKVPYTETDPTDQPASLYGATKKANELMAYAYSDLYGIPATGLRFFTVYGPWGRPDMVYFKFTRAIDERKPIQVFNQGQLERDYTFIDDIVDGIIGLLNLPPKSQPPHEIYNIGNSNPVLLLDLIEVLEKILQKKAIREMMPMQAGDVLRTYADSSKLEQLTGYKPSTPIQNGLESFTDWYFKVWKNIKH